MTDAALRAARFAAHRLSPATAADDAVGVLATLGAVQAQDFTAAKWAVGARMRRGARAADVEQAIADRRIVRAWPMRGTLHLVDPALLRPLFALTGERMIRAMAGRRAQLGLDDDTERDARRIALDRLAVGPASREDLREAWRSGGLDVDGQRAAHLLYRLSSVGHVVLGPIVGNAQHFVLAEDWLAGAPAAAEREADLAMLLERYLRGHGPACLADFAWWTGLTLGDARLALAAAGDAVAPFDAERFVSASAPPPAGSMPPVALAGFDEYFLGYRDRDAVAPAGALDLVVPGGNGMFLPTLVDRGRVVGTWRRTLKGRTAAVELSMFAAGRDPVAVFGPALRRWARFAGCELAEVRSVGA